MVSERIPRVQDGESIRRMMNPLACRLDSIEDAWHVLCTTLSAVSWRSRKIVKNQFDLARYFYLVAARRPEIIVETGLFSGASVLFFLDVLGILNMAEVPYVGIDLDVQPALDIARAEFPDRPVMLVSADCLADATLREVAPLVHGRRALVVLDSVHTEEHVTEELRLYAPLVEPGGSLVVEDTDHNGHPTLRDYGPSAAEAVEKFMSDGGLGKQLGFEYDRDIETAFAVAHGAQPFTNSPSGWLVRR